ncbi:zinc finger protein SNAI3 isoform X2 [Grammomys surdaster]|uniref:zinc finger protein SNAI3 isoform X2 n=1 Tax=Grammomys surdaster TaxID=491861 RepID=UPI00109F8B8E|nr:zinc finger protein SNAI3 isoform X2 [Grammomys surdaster]
MPRSFLVKTHSSHRVPNYGKLETQREANGSCSACGELVGSRHWPDKAPSNPSDPLQPWDSTSAVACISLPLLPCHGETLGASGPEPQETSWVGPRAGQAPSVTLKDSFNLPPLLVLSTRWPPILGPDGALDDHLRAEGTSRVPGSFECVHCHRPYHTLAGLARHQQLHCHLPTGRAFTCSGSISHLPVARKCSRGLPLLLTVRTEHLGNHRDTAATLPLPQKVSDAVILS